jgi:DUF4097 and DUF4098 domain-containing protein YvlB
LKQTTKILLVVAVIVIVAFSLVSYSLFNKSSVQLDLKVDTKTLDYTRLENVTIIASTFNGNVEIQTTTNNTIEVTYKMQAPKGHLDEIIGTTNPDLNQDASTPNVLQALSVKASMSNSSHSLVGNYKADITIKLPTNSKYNLTLTTQNGDIIKPQLNDVSVVARTGNGNINIKDAGANVILGQTQNGNINVALAQGTLFQTNAVSGNGKVSHDDIGMITTFENGSHLIGATSLGQGNLNMTLSASNGNIALTYLNP